MTINSEYSPDSYVGTGLVDTYPFTFGIENEDDLTVSVVDGVSGDITTLVLNSDYSVEIAADASTGGNVVLSSSYGNLGSGDRIIIELGVSYTQPTDIRNQGKFYPEIHEKALDRIVRLCQQLKSEIGRVPVLLRSDIEAGFSPALPAIGAGKFLRVNAAGTEFEFVSEVTPGALSVSAYIETLLDDADAATARATLGTLGIASQTESDTGTDDTKTASVSKIRNTLVKTMEGDVLGNVSLATSVAGGALTIALKGADGNDPSPSNPVFIGVRGTGGDINVRTVTSALSLTIPNGATLDTVDATPYRFWVLAIDNGGTIELAVQQCLHTQSGAVYLVGIGGTAAGSGNDTNIITTTAMSTAADGVSAYSASARTNVPFAVIGCYDSTETVAGVWASTGSIEINPDFRPGMVRAFEYTLWPTDVSLTTDVIPDDDTAPQSTEGKASSAAVRARPYPHCAPDLVEVMANLPISPAAATNVIAAMFKDSETSAVVTARNTFTAASQSAAADLRLIQRRGTAALVTYSLRFGASGAVAVTSGSGVGGASKLAGTMSGFGSAKCISV